MDSSTRCADDQTRGMYRPWSSEDTAPIGQQSSHPSIVYLCDLETQCLQDTLAKR